MYNREQVHDEIQSAFPGEDPKLINLLIDSLELVRKNSIPIMEEPEDVALCKRFS
jgi:hypothetical protein